MFGKILLGYIFVSIAFPVFLFQTIINSKKNIREHKIVFALISLLLGTFVAAYFSDSLSIALIGTHNYWNSGLLQILTYVIIFLITFNTASSSKSENLKYSVYIGSTILALIVLATQLKQIDLPTFAPNLYSSEFIKQTANTGYLLVATSMLLTEIVVKNRYWKLLVIATTMHLLALITSQSYFGIVGVFLVTAISFAVKHRNHNLKDVLFLKDLKHFEILTLAILALTSVWLLSMYYLGKLPYFTLDTTRLLLQDQFIGVKVFINNIFTGIGPEQLDHEFYNALYKSFPEREANLSQGIIPAIRNIYINQAATTGLLGAIPFGYIVYKYLIGLKQSANNKYLPIIAGINFYLIYGLFNFSTPGISILFFILLASFFSLETFKSENGETENPSMKRFLAATFLSISTMLFLAYGIVNIMQAENSYQKALQTESPAQQLNLLNDSVKNNPFEEIYLRQASFANLQIYSETKQQINNDNSRKLAQQALEINHNPINLDFNASLYFNLYTQSKDPFYLAYAKTYQNAAYNQTPNSSLFLNRLAQIYMSEKSYKDALELLNEAIELDQNYWEAYLNRAEIKLINSENVSAIHDLDLVINNSPQIQQIQRAAALKREYGL